MYPVPRDFELVMTILCICRSKQLGDPSSRTPVSRVHVDYNATSGVQRLHAVMPNEAEELSKTPFAVIQVSHLPRVNLVL